MKDFFRELQIKGYSQRSIADKIGISAQRLSKGVTCGWFPIDYKPILDDIAFTCGVDELPLSCYVYSG